jgi:hypothetical protein
MMLTPLSACSVNAANNWKPAQEFSARQRLLAKRWGFGSIESKPRRLQIERDGRFRVTRDERHSPT